jgi:hypothetical protein
MSAEDGAAPGNLGLPNRTMATHSAVLPLWGIVLEQSLSSSGSEVEWCVPSSIDGGGSWQHGAAKVRRRVRVVLHAQGGTFWRVVAKVW